MTNPSLRTLAFGDLDTGLWGAMWASASASASAEPARLGLGLGEDTTSLTVELQGCEQGEEWRLLGDGAELVVAAAGDAVAVETEEATVRGFDQLCRVRGRVVLGGNEHPVECLGQRSALAAPLDLARFDSLRAVSACFEPAEGFSLLALRPRGAKGHESDLVVGAVLAAEGATTVADPRLSTTYRGDGRPLRVGLELWLGDGKTAEEADAEQQYPRRAAGEAAGSGIRSQADRLELQAELLRWHSEGREGAGVYLLARPR